MLDFSLGDLITSVTMEVIKTLSNPEVLASLNQMLNPRSPSDVAKAAIDAYDQGKLSRESAMRIVQLTMTDSREVTTDRFIDILSEQ